MKLDRPYLVIPKLILQPTWGGSYIAQFKNWQEKSNLSHVKIGQAYELFDKSNLSLLTSSTDPNFNGEISDSKAVETPTRFPNTISLSELINADPRGVLGKSKFKRFGPTMPLLIKFTQALGNSFQIHIKDGTTHPKWKPKPESWYFFEPGLVTLGVKSDVDWKTYQISMIEINAKIMALSELVTSGKKTYDTIKKEIDELVRTSNPWQYVNRLEVGLDSLIDLSPCGIHHSWEEDMTRFPLGNVVYELQVNVMDDVATIRNFDKGKMSKNGTVRPLQIEDYFSHIDRSSGANDPRTHMRQSETLADTLAFTHERLLHTKYYTLEKVTYKKVGEFTERINQFRHLFVKNGVVTVTSGETTIQLTQGHSVYIPAGAQEYAIKSKLDKSMVLISY